MQSTQANRNHQMLDDLCCTKGALPGTKRVVAILATLMLNVVQPTQAGIPQFKVPDGFVVELIAGPPLVRHPMSVCFDERGRLFVCEAAGLNLPFKELEKQLPNSIKMLEDTDGDGIFDKVTVFADKMTFPAGVLWHQGALYATSPPYLWKLEDTDNDGKADKRTPLVGKFGSTGNGADLHGPFLGPDGLLYFCDGRNGHDIQTKDGVKIKGRAAGVYRCRTDGTGLERICSGGMDNPVEVAFTPAGEPFVCTNIVGTNPRRDAILYAIDGGVYPHDQAAIAESRGTGELLPINGDLGWVAVSSLIRYRGDHLGAAYIGKYFTAQFNTHKVQLHECMRKGAGFDWRHEEFLATDNADFHPTCVRQHPDGSLVVVDTGGWFRIGCPASQIAKPEIPGGIYRIRPAYRPPLADPYGRKLDCGTMTLADLVTLLDDPRYMVQDKASERISQSAKTMTVQKLADLRNGLRRKSEDAACRGIWALARAESEACWEAIPTAAIDSRQEVALSTLIAASVFRKSNVVGSDGFQMAFQNVSRVRNSAVGPLRHDIRAFERQWSLYAARSSFPKANFTSLPNQVEVDPFLRHALILQAVELKDQTIEMDSTGRTPDKWWPTYVSLVALDLRNDVRLTPDLLLRALNAGDKRVRDAAEKILSRKPTLVAMAKKFIIEQLRTPMSGPNAWQGETVLASLANDSEVQKVMAEQWKDYRPGKAKVLCIIDAASQAPSEKWQPELAEAIGSLLQVEDPEIVAAALAALPTARVKENADALRLLAVRESWDVELRLRAIRVLAGQLPIFDEQLLKVCLEYLTQNDAPLIRRLSSEALANARLTREQIERIIPFVAKAGAFDLPILLKIFEGRTEEPLGTAFVDALDRSPGWKAISAETLRKTLANYPPSVNDRAKPLFEKIATESAKMTEKLASVEALLPTANVDRGRMVFFSMKSACSACHKAERQGADIGPDLSKIGGSRATRDLVESIVYPSLSIVRGYEPYTVATKDGVVLSGILRQETPSTILLAQTDRTVKKIPRSQIESVAPSSTSIMPQGFDGQLTPKELADLVCYLRSLR